MQATDRRGFLKGAALLGAASTVQNVIAAADEHPLLRVAIMSDIQGVSISRRCRNAEPGARTGHAGAA